jgi:hypothetical protein
LSHLKPPPVLGCKQAVHLQQVRRETARPLAADAAAQLQDDVAVVLLILRQHGQQKGLLQLINLWANTAEQGGV